MARVRAFVEDVGLVLAAFCALLAFENIAIGILYRREFVSTWEMQNARNYLTPLGLAASIRSRSPWSRSAATRGRACSAQWERLLARRSGSASRPVA